MTYCEEVGLKVGDKIKFITGDYSGIYEENLLEATLIKDDGTDMPVFETTKGDTLFFKLTKDKWEKLPTKKDYTIGVGSYILKEDIPDEATHNKVLEVFKKCGYDTEKRSGRYNNAGSLTKLAILPEGVRWTSFFMAKHRLTLEQILNYFDEEETMHKKDDIVSVEMTKEELLLINAVLGAGNTSIISGAFSRILDQVEDIFETDDLPSLPFELIDVYPHQNKWEEEIEEFFNPKPTEKQLRQEKIRELESKLKELKDLDN